MEKQSTNATAALATMNLRDRTDDGSGGSDLSSDLSSDDEVATSPTPPVRATIFRRKEEDHSEVAQLGVNQVTYHPRVNQFIAHKEKCETTLSLVGKTPTGCVCHMIVNRS